MKRFFKLGIKPTAKKMLCCIAVFMLIIVLCPILLINAEEATDATLVDVGIPVEEHPELFITRSMPTHGEGKIAVFLIQFPDYLNENPYATVAHYEEIYFGDGVLYDVGRMGVSAFYHDESYGKLNISGQVFDWYTAQHERAYYDDKKAELVMEAAEYYVAQGVDFSQFDGDDDGVIDAILFHFAGEYSYIRSDPWYSGVNYGASSLSGHGIIGGLKFTTMIQIYEGAAYSINPTFVMTICHELMHSFGMPDLYGETYFGLLGANDLMSSNKATINPYTKLLLGWFDSVQVITSNTFNVELKSYGTDPDGRAVIVTDEFNGIFDEFYMVAYRDYQGNDAAIWHIDARLNESETAFINSNQYYDPDPDTDNGHESSYGYISPYLFIEELSADPEINLVLGAAGTQIKDMAFNEGSALGPNAFPSSDKHSGEYTGIRIDNFKEHNEEYLTFDVSFVEDSASPVIIVNENELEFHETVKIQFNEFIYKGENWDGIQVTNLNGEILDTTVFLSYYPRNEIKIVFHTGSPIAGYKLIFPEDCVRDSSGNGMKALTMTATNDRYFFPISEEQLPGTGEYRRDNSNAFFFNEKDSVVIITSLGVGTKQVEFMRLDLQGNLLNQTIVDNPFNEPDLLFALCAHQTADGSYILQLNDFTSSNFELFFCLDANGKLKWVNDSYQGGETRFYENTAFKTDNGLAILREERVLTDSAVRQYVCIDSKTGEILPMADELADYLVYGSMTFWDLSDGKLMIAQTKWAGSGLRTSLRIYDTNTMKVIKEAYLPEIEGKYYTVEKAMANDDGTYIIRCSVDQQRDFLLLDAELNVIKTVSRKNLSLYNEWLMWFENDGFCALVLTEEGNHSNKKFRAFRYDRYLNLIWSSDVEANFIYYFTSPSGELFAYKSMWEPERDCYVEYYGSEEDYRIHHVHDLMYFAATEANCLERGHNEYWFCTDCGCYYSDEGQTRIIDVHAFFTPKTGHTEVAILAIPPTCTQVGWTEGLKCAVCNKVFLEPTEQSPLKHQRGDWVVDKNPTCLETGLQILNCVICGEELERRKLATSDTYHTYGDWIVTKTANCIEAGELMKVCSVCGSSLKDEIPISESHTYGEWIITKQSTCIEAGERAKSCAICNKSITQIIPASELHSYGNWIVTKIANCIEAGELTKVCSVCGVSINDEIPINESHTYGEWIMTKQSTCIEAGENTRSCAICNKSETEVIPKREKHAYGDWIVSKEATCNETGERMKTCTWCNMVETEEILKNERHTYGEWYISKDATCIALGEKSRICTVCDKIETQELHVKGKHVYGDWVITKKAICTEDGEETTTCLLCGNDNKTKVIPALGHTEKTVPASEPKCTEVGMTEGMYCSVCNEILIAQKTIPAKGHTEVVDNAVDATCTTDGKTEGTHCSVCNEVLTAQKVILATGNHSFGDWIAIDNNSEEIRSCMQCDYKETRTIEKPTETFEESFGETFTEYPTEIVSEKSTEYSTSISTEKPTEEVTDTHTQEPNTGNGCKSTIDFNIIAFILIFAAGLVVIKKRQ